MIDAETMTLHHQEHHQSYVDALNAALADYPELQGRTLGELLTTLPELPEEVRQDVQNQGGGHLNHALWWRWVAPGGSREPVGRSAERIAETFGDLEGLKEPFNAAADARFGSGWAWLVVDESGRLSVLSTPNQDHPISQGLVPLLGLDVWEHAYYLSYRNRRPEYINAFWEVVNWDAVEEQHGVAAALFGF
ncbi:superoxide dismutase [Truepera radiovictrix]|uniref:superoxide dismutase n=1 Tax=Truepera radiovictrix TaxID=332249 RepID=UPI001FDFC6D5|nr:superoxide dismutase [Truepera radiovictrix]WMT58829.1 superoxide dismutase [Truepera radiovictrix]